MSYLILLVLFALFPGLNELFLLAFNVPPCLITSIPTSSLTRLRHKLQH